MLNRVGNFTSLDYDCDDEAFKNLSIKSVRIKANIQLKYLKYKLNDYLGSYILEK